MNDSFFPFIFTFLLLIMPLIICMKITQKPIKIVHIHRSENYTEARSTLFFCLICGYSFHVFRSIDKAHMFFDRSTKFPCSLIDEKNLISKMIFFRTILQSVDKNRNLKLFFDEKNVSWMEFKRISFKRLEKFKNLEKVEKLNKKSRKCDLLRILVILKCL